MGDEATKIFLCAGGDADDVSEEMKDFLEWLTGKEGKSILVQNLENAVKAVKNKEEWRLEYMTLLMRDQEMMQKGRSIEEIADCVDFDVETVKKWITALI